MPQEDQPVACLRSIEQALDTNILGAKTFLVEVVNDAGISLKEPSYWTLETRKAAHDVADLLPYVITENGELLIGVVTSFRPATLLTKDPKILEEAFTAEAFLQSQPGSYVELKPGQGSASLKKTAESILINKLGLSESLNVEILPTSSFPNPKDSSEYVVQLAAQVTLPAELQRAIPGNGLAAGRRVEFIPAQEVINRYLTGAIQDPRLLQGTMALAERMAVKLEIPQIDGKNSTAHQLPENIPQHLSLQSTIDFIRNSPQISGQAIHLKLSAAPEQTPSYLTTVKALAEIQTGIASEQVQFNALIQPNIRYTHCLCFTENDQGQVLVLVNKGLRPSLALRKSTTHPIGTELPDWSIEALSFPSDDPLKSDTASRIINKLKERGITPDQVIQISETEFPSPGFSPCCISRNLVRVSKVNTEQLNASLSESLVQPELAWIELNSLLSAINLGEVHDLNLITSARWLQGSLNYERTRLHLWTPSERSQFSELVIQESPLLNLINATAEGRELHAKLYGNKVYRGLLQYGQSKLGIVPKEFQHHEEQIFFDAGLAVFAMPDAKNGASFIIQLLHDLRHYAIGSMIPFFCDKNRQIIQDTNGQVKAQSQAEYDAAYRENEAEAGFFSHYDLPRLIGLEDSDIVLGFQPLSTVFDKLGIKDREQARLAFRTIEFDRIIPKEILTAPAYQQPEIRGAILQLLKLARIFDCHMEELYPRWLKYPKVAQTALDFSETIVTSLADHLNSFQSSLNQTLENPEGFNPFKTHVSQFINVEIRMRALRLAYAHELLREELVNEQDATETINSTMAQIDLQLTNLLANYNKFITARDNCKSLDYTVENLVTLRMLNRFTKDQAPRIDALYQEAICLLPEAQQQLLVGRELPFFPRLEFGKGPEITAYAEERERLSFELAFTSTKA